MIADIPFLLYVKSIPSEKMTENECSAIHSEVILPMPYMDTELWKNSDLRLKRSKYHL